MTDCSGQERLAALVELSTDAVLLIDASGVIRWASPSILNVLGFAPDEMVGAAARDFVAPDDLVAWHRFVDDLLATAGEPRDATFSSRHRDGSFRRTTGTARNLLAEPRVAAIVVQFRDVTNVPRDQGAEQLAHDRYRQLFEDATDVIFETDRDGCFTLINPATLRTFGYAAEEVLGRRFTGFIRDDYRPVVQEHYRRQVEARERASYIEFPAVTRDNGEIWLGLSAWLALDGDGSYHGMRAVGRDIGERRRAEEALRHAQKMEAVGRLAGGIAHDFNNLLAAIRGNAELLLHHLMPDPARVADVEEILHAADRAATMTRQLLAFSRKHAHASIRLDLDQLVENVARLSRRLLGPEIVLERESDPSLHAVMADPSQLEQLLLNLVLNARDAIPHGGRIIVRTANRELPDRAPDSALADVPSGPYVLLQVIDDGVGMDQATQARIFEPFFTTKEPGRGTGLGLSTVYGIVRQMGGAVTVLSERHHGSTFSVFLPAVIENQETKHA